MSTPRRQLLTAASIASVAVMSACAGGGASDVVAPAGNASAASVAAGGSVNLVGYSVAKSLYSVVLPGFAATADGKNVTVQQSYGPSGDQSRKVAAGAPADLVSFSTEPDITRLVKAGLVNAGWNTGADHGIPFGSVVTIVVRKGNPKGIKDWDDLLKPGVSVVTPNPFSSGSAKWNLLAPYGAKSAGGTNRQAGLTWLATLVGQHIHVQPGSAREATETFAQGTGDALLTYENEAIADVRAGDAVEYVTPPQTFKIENPVAVTTNAKNPAGAAALLAYLRSAAGQELVAKAGFRPVDPAVAAAHAADFPAPQKLWTIADLGGWAAVDADLFDKDKGAIAAIYSKATS